jgi:hypothetical protein
MKNILRTFQREAFKVTDFKLMFPSLRTGFFIKKRAIHRRDRRRITSNKTAVAPDKRSISIDKSSSDKVNYNHWHQEILLNHFGYSETILAKYPWLPIQKYLYGSRIKSNDSNNELIWPELAFVLPIDIRSFTFSVWWEGPYKQITHAEKV